MRLALIALSATMLAGCGDDAAKSGPERRSAAGEVLGGEVTDDMLPLDTVRSTSPAESKADTPSGPSRGAPADRADIAPDPAPQPEVSGGPGQRQPEANEATDRSPLQ